MSGLCVGSGQDYAQRAGLHLRSAAPDEEALSRVHLFRSMEAALSFAFLWRACEGVKIGKIEEFIAADSSGTALSTNEKKVQSSHMMAVIDDLLTPNQRAVLDATHGGEHGERHAAIERLACTLEDANRNRTLLRMTLMREFVFGERYMPSQWEVAKECGVNQATVSRVAAKIAPAVAMLRETAMETLRPAFERRSWIPREQT